MAEYGKRFHKTANGSTSATATVTGAAHQLALLNKITVVTDKATALLQVKDGTTVIWAVPVNATVFSEYFPTPLPCTPGNDLVVTIDGTSACYVNIAGVTIQG